MPLPSNSAANNDNDAQMRENLPDLLKALQNNAIAMQGVIQRMDVIAKDIEEMKKQLPPQCQASSASVKPSTSKIIPSELSVSY